MGWFTLLSVTLGWFVSVGQDSKTRFGNLFEHSYSHAPPPRRPIGDTGSTEITLNFKKGEFNVKHL